MAGYGDGSECECCDAARQTKGWTGDGLSRVTGMNGWVEAVMKPATSQLGQFGDSEVSRAGLGERE